MSGKHGKMKERRSLLLRAEIVGAVVEKRTVKAVAGLGAFGALVGLFVVNQVTTSSVPTAIYTPGPRQPLAVATSPSPHTRPHPATTTTTLSKPMRTVPMATPSPQKDSRYGVRTPLRHRQPVHHPAPPVHRPQPTPPPSSPPPKDPGLLCHLLGICLAKGPGLGVWVHPHRLVATSKNS